MMKQGETAFVSRVMYRTADGVLVDRGDVFSMPEEEGKRLADSGQIRRVTQANPGEIPSVIETETGAFIAGLEGGSKMYVVGPDGTVHNDEPFEDLDEAMDEAKRNFGYPSDPEEDHNEEGTPEEDTPEEDSADSGE